MIIRAFERCDWPVLWPMLEAVFRAGETYAVATDLDEASAYRYWIELPAATCVAVDDDGTLLGTYYIKANQQGPGDHVANCGYVVGQAARGRGIAGALCEHSQQQALALGFVAMQYNCVVATNSGAVRLWQRHGFDIVGTLPAVFRHPREGLVDAYVMYKSLQTGDRAINR